MPLLFYILLQTFSYTINLPEMHHVVYQVVDEALAKEVNQQLNQRIDDAGSRVPIAQVLAFAHPFGPVFLHQF